MTAETTNTRARRSLPSMSVLGPIVALVVLVAIGAMMNSNFLGAANITNVLARSAFIGIIAVGATFVIASGGLASIEDVKRLAAPDCAVLEGAISGRALYDGRLDPTEALKVLAAG